MQPGLPLIDSSRLRSLTCATRPRHRRRSRAARRPAERGRRRSRRPTRSRSSTPERRRLPGDRGVGVRQPEVGAADGGCRGRVRRHRRRPGPLHGAGAEPRRARARGGGGRRRGRDLRGRVRDVQPAQHQPDHRRIARRAIATSARARRRPACACAATCPPRSAARTKAPFRRAGRRALRGADRHGRVRGRGQRHDRHRPSRTGRRRRRCLASRVPLDRSRSTSTTRAAPRSRTCSRRWTSASRRSTRRRAGSAGARMRRARPAIWRPRIWSTCSTAWASRPASISRGRRGVPLHRGARRPRAALSLRAGREGRAW